MSDVHDARTTGNAKLASGTSVSHPARRRLGRLGVLVSIVLISLILAEIIVRAVQPIPDAQLLPLSYNVEALNRIRDGTGYLRFNQELGWVTGRNALARVGKATYQSNAAGQRAKREYTLAPQPGVLRLAAFGDSFTHCDEVDLSDCWTTRLEEGWPDTEVVNFGVPGYGPDQAWLRYQREGQAYQPCAVLIGYFVENINRTVNRFRPFYEPDDGIPLSKPRFVSDGEGLSLLPNPTTEVDQLLDPEWIETTLGPDDDWYFPGVFAPTPLGDLFDLARVARSAAYRQSRRAILRGDSRYPLYFENHEAVEVVERLLLGFARDVERSGATPVVLFFGGRRDSAEAAEETAAPPYLPLVKRLADDGIATVDLGETVIPSVRRRGTDVLFAEGGHYSTQGNRLLASTLVERLPELTQGTCAP